MSKRISSIDLKKLYDIRINHPAAAGHRIIDDCTSRHFEFLDIFDFLGTSKRNMYIM